MRLKLTYVITLALLIACGLASTATAHEWQIESGILPETIWPRIETKSVNALSGTPFGVAVRVNCATRETEPLSRIEAEGKSFFEIEFKSCTATKPANCTVKEPIGTKLNGQLAGTPGFLEEHFTTPPEHVFWTVELQGGSCSLKGKPFTVTGSQNCELPGVETWSFVQQLECHVTGSSLTAGGKTATFETNFMLLEMSFGEDFRAV